MYTLIILMDTQYAKECSSQLDAIVVPLCPLVRLLSKVFVEHAVLEELVYEGTDDA
jgi:hypothetical protein